VGGWVGGGSSKGGFRTRGAYPAHARRDDAARRRHRVVRDDPPAARPRASICAADLAPRRRVGMLTGDEAGDDDDDVRPGVARAMDADELLARSLQQEENALAAAASARDDDVHAAFASRLRGGVETVSRHHDDLAKAVALSVVPLDRLDAEARALVTASRAAAAAAAAAAADASSPSPSPAAKEISHEDARLLRLLRWFKREFFRWCDAPPCDVCGASGPELVSCVGMTPPTANDLAHGASRVEAYACASATCDGAVTTRFPRYNDASKLLETRRGRCGEFANAFAQLCVALGYDTRWVIDWEDHVWCEVFSASQGRWLHCDACEDACDQPLLYEKGWGKKLSYAIAFGRGGVKDVTRRYVVDFDATVAARTRACDDAWLAGALRDASASVRAACGGGGGGGGGGDGADDGDAAAAAAAMEAKRNADEDDELAAAAANATSREGDHQETLPGRKTGSVAWRAARGELGDAVSAAKAEEARDEIEPAAPPAPPRAKKVELSDEVKAAYEAQEAELKAEFRKLVLGGMAREEAATTAVDNVKKARARAPR